MGINVICSITTIENKIQEDADKLIHADFTNASRCSHEKPNMNLDITKLYQLLECAGITEIQDYGISVLNVTETTVINKKSDDSEFFLKEVTIPYDAETLLKMHNALNQLQMDFFDTICRLEKIYADVCNIGTSILFVNTNILSLAIDNALCIYNKHEKMFSSILDVVNTK